MIVIAMGVCGTGKTLIGELLSERLACEFLDGDTLHSAANKSKMSQGIPLTDEDRLPWLQAIRQAIEAKQRDGETAVFTCSSLKRMYRDILRGQDQNVKFVYLKVLMNYYSKDLQKDLVIFLIRHCYKPN